MGGFSQMRKKTRKSVALTERSGPLTRGEIDSSASKEQPHPITSEGNRKEELTYKQVPVNGCKRAQLFAGSTGAGSSGAGGVKVKGGGVRHKNDLSPPSRIL